ncbi:MAG: Crp/Fnr family transcriptional regulator [Pseudomonadales bacterium]|nr:Crp/Fnr family transcriptional regulator [Pseudomonadales bacterium]
MEQEEGIEFGLYKQQLSRLLGELGVRDKQEQQAIETHCRLVFFEKGEILHRSGEVADQIFYIGRGLVRLYYITADGKEHNKSFAIENDFVGATQSIEKPTPSRFYLQALESTRAIAVSIQGLRQLFYQSLSWANLGRLYMEALAMKKTQREASLLLDSAEVRYREFLDSDPDLADRLPLYHVASYLGITDVALSRIRKRLNIAPV